MSNISLSLSVLKKIKALGVRHICVCAGARNAPLVLLLGQMPDEFQIFSFFDERSAGFFALGLAQQQKSPVAVLTTSGTAVTELYSAAVEATYAGVPLVLITADRPRSYRGTGAPQSIDQAGVFFKYVETTWDIENEYDIENVSLWSQTQPVHINVSFDEPLVDEDISQIKSLGDAASESTGVRTKIGSTIVRKVNDPLVIVGTLKESETETVVDWILENKVPVYAETLSNLHQHPEVRPYLIQSSDSFVEKYMKENFFKSIVRIGGVPTLRLWRDLEQKYIALPVFSCSSTEWRGLSRPLQHRDGIGFLEYFKANLSDEYSAAMNGFKKQDVQYALQLVELFNKYPEAEPSMVYHLQKKLENQNLYIGNSLPIREIDLVPSIQKKFAAALGNRGVNGIDGQISTFFGWSLLNDCRQSNCLIGDLTALYDLNSPWIFRQNQNLLEGRSFNIYVLNNSGGQIFKKLFKSPAMLNEHDINFESWAAMWKSPYQKITSAKDFGTSNSQSQKNGLHIYEIVPDAEMTTEFWKDYGNL